MVDARGPRADPGPVMPLPVAAALVLTHAAPVAAAPAATATAPTAPGATTPTAPAPRLAGDTTTDLVFGGVATGLWILAETAGKSWFAPDACRWCDPPGFDASARSLRWSTPVAAEVAGAGTAFLAAPAAAFGLTWLAAAHDDRTVDQWTNVLWVVQGVSTTMVLTNVVKWSLGRERPAVHYRAPDWGNFAVAERNLSFFSGHSSLAFSLAVSSGTVASLRGYSWAPVVWAVGLPIAAFTAYSRIAADAHYLSDVVVGSLMGALIGGGIPLLFHGRIPAPKGVTLAPFSDGRTVGLAGTFGV